MFPGSTNPEDCNLEEEFRKLDVNNDGMITMEEVTQVMMSVQVPGLEDVVIKERIKKAERNGKINYLEFLKQCIP